MIACERPNGLRSGMRRKLRPRYEALPKAERVMAGKKEEQKVSWKLWSWAQDSFPFGRGGQLGIAMNSNIDELG